MKDIDDLRHALAAETADLAVHLPPETIRRRARRLRVRRSAGIAAAGALAVVALATPTVLLNGGSGYQAAGPMPPASEPACPTPADPHGKITWLGPLVETGVTLDAPHVNARYDVLLGLLYAPVYASPGSDQQLPGYGFVIAFRDQKTGAVQNWDMLGLGRDPNGDFPGKRPGDPGHQFQSSQLTLGPNSVLDVGLYSRSAQRITVASEGRATEARTAQNAATGWTFFWVRRDAAPLPEGHNTTPVEYTGPEQLTITAYDVAGKVQHSVTGGFHVGHHAQNPRDHQPVEESTAPATTALATTAPTCPPASTTK